VLYGPAGRWRIVVFSIALATVLGVQLYAVFGAQQGVPRSTLGRQRFVAGEVAAGAVVSQTLRMDAPGFHRIRIFAQPFSKTVSGDVVFTLKEISGGGERELYRLIRPAATVVRGDAFDVDFPPIAQSEGRRYRLDVRAPNAPAGRGIGLWATNEERHAGGALFVHGKEQWGDLAFDTYAASSTAYDYIDRPVRGKPWPLSTRWFLGVVFITYNIGLAGLLWIFVGKDR